jgi:enamine deaminase RidA (YjgF/YER057c/UK114 family)
MEGEPDGARKDRASRAFAEARLVNPSIRVEIAAIAAIS